MRSTLEKETASEKNTGGKAERISEDAPSERDAEWDGDRAQREPQDL
jgi:hypothetical protein